MPTECPHLPKSCNFSLFLAPMFSACGTFFFNVGKNTSVSFPAIAPVLCQEGSCLKCLVLGGNKSATMCGGVRLSLVAKMYFVGEARSYRLQVLTSNFKSELAYQQ